MIDEYNKASLWFGIPGLGVQLLGIPIRDSPTGFTMIVGGGVLLTIGLSYYAKAKGQPSYYGLLGLTSCLGLFILALLPDRAQDGREQMKSTAVGTPSDLPLPTSPVMAAEGMSGSTVSTSTAGRGYAWYQVSMPAILLMAMGLLTIATVLFYGVVMNQNFVMSVVLKDSNLSDDTQSTLAVISNLFQFILGGLTFFGGLKMKNLKRYGFALAASIIVLIPLFGSCFCLGIPVGIWALVVLNKPQVKSAFQQL